MTQGQLPAMAYAAGYGKSNLYLLRSLLSLPLSFPAKTSYSRHFTPYLN